MAISLETIYPCCLERLSPAWRQTLEADAAHPEEFIEILTAALPAAGLPAFLPDLARLELAWHRCRQAGPAPDLNPDAIEINPLLELVDAGWSGLPGLLDRTNVEPTAEAEFILVWQHPHSGRCRRAPATPDDLLALKLVAEAHDLREIAAAQQQPVGVLDRAIEKAVHKGLLLRPKSHLRRNPEDLPAAATTLERFLVAEAFTLQWHITQRCDLNCRHCYDRSDQQDVSFAQGLNILDQLRDFCQQHHVAGQVSFSGGNPFLHPEFNRLYRAAVERKLTPAILGNPVSDTQLDQLLEIEKPVFYQVSLEGLQEHNDYIRGAGNFNSVMAFLELLKSRDIYSMVMLTLTRNNLDQVLPLAEKLRNLVDLFTYNRLSTVGQGAVLKTAEKPEYQAFVRDYLQACQDNPAMAMKDNLINIERERQELNLFGGCTGFGCGAAFNFVSLLANGEVHACRKFPSPIGNIQTSRLEEIYASTAASAYRRGAAGCVDCHLRPVCGGCLAVTYGNGLDPLKDIDPACFLPAGVEKT